jgi:hypothetical protein
MRFATSFLIATVVLTSTAQAQALGRGYVNWSEPTDGTPSSVWSAFRADISGAVAASLAGEAEFGVPEGAAGSGTVVSLGVRGGQSAILFTRTVDVPLAVGRYPITDFGGQMDEVVALIVTGQSTSPKGVFRGQSGWLEVISVSEDWVTGRFQVDGVGFLAATPDVEDRRITVTGTFAAIASGS